MTSRDRVLGTCVVVFASALIAARIVADSRSSDVLDVCLLLLGLVAGWFVVDRLGWRWRLSGRAAMHSGTCVNVRRLPAGSRATLVVDDACVLLIDARSRCEVIPAAALAGVSRRPVGSRGGRGRQDGLRLDLTDGGVIDCVVLTGLGFGTDEERTSAAHAALTGLIRTPRATQQPTDFGATD